MAADDNNLADGMLLNVVADDDLSPDNAVEYTSAGSAIVPRETLSGVLGNAGAIASSRTVDPSIE